jgi:uncharacterized heparinase superfamily protein
LPIVNREANDHAYLLALGAVLFKDRRFKAEVAPPQELLWILGDDGWQAYQSLESANLQIQSHAFPHAATYVLRQEDLFLLFNANSGRKNRPTSHQHNDVLSIEVSAGGRAFIVDPGTHVYTADLHERHIFRSTAYHSTVQIDDAEQRTINEDAPFVNGQQASARVLVWESTAEGDHVVAEHNGYERLAKPVIHRRAIHFDKANRWWLVEDELVGKGEHKVATRFHFDTGLQVTQLRENAVVVSDEKSGARLLVLPLAITAEIPSPVFEPQFVSRHYGSKLPSTTANWTTNVIAPGKLRWAIVPVGADETLEERMTLDFRL